MTNVTKTTEILKRTDEISQTFLGKMDVKTRHPTLQTKQKH